MYALLNLLYNATTTHTHVDDAKKRLSSFPIVFILFDLLSTDKILTI